MGQRAKLQLLHYCVTIKKHRNEHANEHWRSLVCIEPMMLVQFGSDGKCCCFSVTTKTSICTRPTTLVGTNTHTHTGITRLIVLFGKGAARSIQLDLNIFWKNWYCSKGWYTNGAGRQPTPPPRELECVDLVFSSSSFLCVKQFQTGWSSFFLLFGRETRLSTWLSTRCALQKCARSDPIGRVEEGACKWQPS